MTSQPRPSKIASAWWFGRFLVGFWLGEREAVEAYRAAREERDRA